MSRAPSNEHTDQAETAAAAKQFEKLIEVISRSQHNYRELIDNLDQAVFTIALNGDVRVANRRCCEILGVSFQGLIGHNLREFVEEPRADPLQQAILGFLKKGSWSGRALVRLKGERLMRQFECWLQAIAEAPNAAGAPPAAGAVIGWARDITQVKQIEQQLAHSERFAAIGQMMGGAAHELNNPLTAILGVSDLLRERATDDAMRRHLDLISQQARRAAAIVQDLMALSRPPSAARSIISMDDVVRGLLHTLEPSLCEKKIALKLEVAAGLPPVEGDAKQLSQVFLNIFANAEQAIAPGVNGGSLTVKLSASGGKICVATTDSGAGISADHLDKIFDPFFSTKRPGGGSGLGLTICLAVVKDHGGTIEVDSAPGRGSTVRVFLPAAGPAISQAGAARVAEKCGGLGENRSVLVVDDEEGIRDVISETLSARGVRVECAGDAQQALAQLAAGAYDAILCDFNLPGMRGPELYKQIQTELGAQAPRCVFITGELLDSGTIAGFTSQGISVLHKPFTMAALASLLAELFQAALK
ncbi:MAG TPA: ATP-binding protein [Candidatus Acidoferrales bacterium]|nr:ATP-binding protein [Candidatus Acidoferrales bacterium]